MLLLLLEGELAVLGYCDNGKDVRFFCKWGVNEVEWRRRLTGLRGEPPLEERRLNLEADGEGPGLFLSQEGDDIKLYSTKPEHLRQGGRRLKDPKDVEIGTVECSIKWDGQEITQTWAFPDGWGQGTKFFKNAAGIDVQSYGFAKKVPYTFDNGDTLIGVIGLAIPSSVSPVTGKNVLRVKDADPWVFCPGVPLDTVATGTTVKTCKAVGTCPTEAP